MIAGYRRAVDQAGREPGEVILQGMASWAEDDDTALESSREWKGTLVDEHYTIPSATPRRSAPTAANRFQTRS